jgi:AraC-like DNA-binding protein
MIGSALPLAKFARFSTDSLEFVRHAMTQAYCNHGISTDKAHRRLAARHHQVELNSVSLNYLTYGAELTILANELPDFFLVDFPLSGHAAYRVSARDFVCDEGRGCIVSAGCGVRAVWSADCQIITLKFRRSALERYLSDALECRITRPLRFEPEVDCSSGAGASLRALVSFLVGELDHADAVRHLPLWARQMERSLAIALLSAQPHNYTAALQAKSHTISPGYVRRAQAFIRANLAGGGIDMRQIAEAAGVPERTLFASYRKYVGLSPIAHYRALRLQAARSDLVNPQENDSVASIACRWGFYHLGHFSRDYVRRFGEKPSATLNAHR